MMRSALSLSEKGSDPLEASRLHCFLGLAGEGQPPFRPGISTRLPGLASREQQVASRDSPEFRLPKGHYDSACTAFINGQSSAVCKPARYFASNSFDLAASMRRTSRRFPWIRGITIES